MAQQYALVPQVLEMLADMRQQFASMLMDIRFVPSSMERPREAHKRKGCVALPQWLDGRHHAWNQHAADSSVVSLGYDSVVHSNNDTVESSDCQQHNVPAYVRKM